MLDSVESSAEDELYDEIAASRQKGKPFRIYFKCRKGSSEKALWLEAFSRIQRLSITTRHTHGFVNTLTNGIRLRNHRARTRTNSRRQLAADTGRLDDDYDDFSTSSDRSGVTARVNELCFGKPSPTNEQNEYKVIPGYAYPHRWMSLHELHNEMVMHSSHFYDLRSPNQSAEEIGDFKVEVLQCVGLPHLDRKSDTNAVVYMVCGACAFVTDVIPDRCNPIWLRKSRRACVFPIYHGYARLYVGVFDDGGGWVKDDFIGRIVIDMARLRHKSTYDVTLPLRMSTHAYCRRKRGAIRLRFTLNWKSEKGVLFSYIPKKIKFTLPQNAKPNTSTTIACADPKAFRNVAITVHGHHLSGRFTFHKIQAAIREMNFTRNYVMDTITQEIKDTRTWVNPTISCYVFCAWMHCIYANKCSLVPGYIVLYAVLQLMRTYAMFLVQGPMSEGFLPPTWEEMFHALITPRTTTSFEPLHLYHDDGANAPADHYSENTHIKTHEPKGLFLLKSLGFLPRNEACDEKRNLHLEFPFADGETYTRFTIRESVADSCADNEDAPGRKEFDDDESQFESPSAFSMDSTADPSVSDKRLSPMRRTTAALRGTSTGNRDDSSQETDDDDDVEQNTSGDDGPDIHDQPRLRSGIKKIATAATAGAEALNPMKLIKDQDLDWNDDDSNNEKLTDSLERIKYKMHSVTWQSFNDVVYEIKNPQSVYFFEAKNIGKRPQKKEKKKDQLDKKLDKLLGVKKYSSSNPLVSRLGLYVEPMVDGVLGYLCLFRALFNVMTWQDPYLTFLLSVALLLLALVLFIFPWRPTLFAIGMLFVGPQNLLIRILRECGKLSPVKPKEHKDEVEEQHDLNVFHCHKRTEGIFAPKPAPDVDPRELQHIVVPYGHLMYQRL